jgi:hypothetical protein
MLIYESNGLPLRAGSQALAKPDDPHQLLGDAWVDADPLDYMYLARQWLGTADARGYRVEEERQDAKRKLEKEFDVELNEAALESYSMKLASMSDGGFIAERAAAANATATGLTIQVRRELITLCLRGTRAIAAANGGDDVAALITEYRERITAARATYDQATNDNPDRTAEMPSLMRGADVLSYALRELVDECSKRDVQPVVVVHKDGGEQQLFPSVTPVAKDEPAEAAGTRVPDAAALAKLREQFRMKPTADTEVTKRSPDDANAI